MEEEEIILPKEGEEAPKLETETPEKKNPFALEHETEKGINPRTGRPFEQKSTLFGESSSAPGTVIEDQLTEAQRELRDETGATVTSSTDAHGIRSSRQSVWEQIGAAALNTVGDSFIGLGEFAGYAGEGVMRWFDKDDRDFSNALTRGMAENRGWLSRLVGLELYRKNPEKFIDLSDSAFIAQTTSDLISSIISFGAAGKIAGLAAGVMTKNVGKTTRMLVEAGKMSAKAGKFITSGAQTVAPVMSSAALSYVESAMSGADVYEQTFDKAIKEDGLSAKEAQALATDASNKTVAIGTSLGTLLNITSILPFHKKPKEGILSDIRRRSGETTAAYKSRLKGLGDTKDSALKILGSYAGEMSQEAIEEFSQVYATNRGLVEGGVREGESALQTLIRSAVSEEGLFSMALGAIGGAAMKGGVDLLQGSRENNKGLETQARDKFIEDLILDIGDIETLSDDLANAYKEGHEEKIVKAKKKLFNVRALRSIENGTAHNLLQSLEEMKALDADIPIAQKIIPQTQQLESEMEMKMKAFESKEAEETRKFEQQKEEDLKALTQKIQEAEQQISTQEEYAQFIEPLVQQQKEIQKQEYQISPEQEKAAQEIEDIKQTLESLHNEVFENGSMTEAQKYGVSEHPGDKDFQQDIDLAIKKVDELKKLWEENRTLWNGRNRFKHEANILDLKTELEELTESETKEEEDVDPETQAKINSLREEIAEENKKLKEISTKEHREKKEAEQKEREDERLRKKIESHAEGKYSEPIPLAKEEKSELENVLENQENAPNPRENAQNSGENVAKNEESILNDQNAATNESAEGESGGASPINLSGENSPVEPNVPTPPPTNQPHTPRTRGRLLEDTSFLENLNTWRSGQRGSIPINKMFLPKGSLPAIYNLGKDDIGTELRIRPGDTSEMDIDSLEYFEGKYKEGLVPGLNDDILVIEDVNGKMLGYYPWPEQALADSAPDLFNEIVAFRNSFDPSNPQSFKIDHIGPGSVNSYPETSNNVTDLFEDPIIIKKGARPGAPNSYAPILNKDADVNTPDSFHEVHEESKLDQAAGRQAPTFLVQDGKGGYAYRVIVPSLGDASPVNAQIKNSVDSAINGWMLLSVYDDYKKNKDITEEEIAEWLKSPSPHIDSELSREELINISGRLVFGSDFESKTMGSGNWNRSSMQYLRYINQFVYANEGAGSTNLPHELNGLGFDAESKIIQFKTNGKAPSPMLLQYSNRMGYEVRDLEALRVGAARKWSESTFDANSPNWLNMSFHGAGKPLHMMTDMSMGEKGVEMVAGSAHDWYLSQMTTNISLVKDAGKKTVRRNPLIAIKPIVEPAKVKQEVIDIAAETTLSQEELNELDDLIEIEELDTALSIRPISKEEVENLKSTSGFILQEIIPLKILNEISTSILGGWHNNIISGGHGELDLIIDQYIGKVIKPQIAKYKAIQGKQSKTRAAKINKLIEHYENISTYKEEIKQDVISRAKRITNLRIKADQVDEDGRANRDRALHQKSRYEVVTGEVNPHMTTSSSTRTMLLSLPVYDQKGKVGPGLFGPKYVPFKNAYSALLDVLGGSKPSESQVLANMEAAQSQYLWMPGAIAKFKKMSKAEKNAFISNFTSFQKRNPVRVVMGRNGIRLLGAIDAAGQRSGRIATDWRNGARLKGLILSSESGKEQYSKPRLKSLRSELEGLKDLDSQEEFHAGLSSALAKFGLNISVETLDNMIYQEAGAGADFKKFYYKGRGAKLRVLESKLDSIIASPRPAMIGSNLDFMEESVVKQIAAHEASTRRFVDQNSYIADGKILYMYAYRRPIVDQIGQVESRLGEWMSDPFNASSPTLQALAKSRSESTYPEQLSDHFAIVEPDNESLRIQGKSLGKGKKRIVDLSDSDKSFFKISSVLGNNAQFVGTDQALYLQDTPADKSSPVMIRAKWTNYTNEAGGIDNRALDDLYNTNILPELRRITSLARVEKGISGYDKAAMFFNMPFMNEPDIYLRLFDKNGNPRKGALDAEGNIIDPDLLGNVYKGIRSWVAKEANDTLAHWKKVGLISNTSGQIESRVFNQSEWDLIGNRVGAKPNSSRALKIQKLAIEMTINYGVTHGESQMILHGDPAFTYKGKGKSDFIEKLQKISFYESEENLDLDKANALRSQVIDSHTAWVDNYVKRMAKSIAPGYQGSGWHDESHIQIMTDDPMAVNRNAEFAKSLFGEGSRAHKAYQKELELADAQEYVTIQEHLHILATSSLITQEQYERYEAIVNNGEEFTNSDLTDIFGESIIRATKPVQSGFSVGPEGFSTHYIKSSAVPLIPQITKHFPEMDKMRIMMEDLQKREGKKVRLTFKSANKIGHPSDSPAMFDGDGKFIQEGDPKFRVLPRSQMYIQQDVPFKEDLHINNVTQASKTLFNNVLGEKIKGNLKGNHYYKKYLEANKIIYQEQYDKLIQEIKNDDGSFDYPKLEKLLIDEAETRGMSYNDIEGLRLNDAKFFDIPLWAHPNANRLESMIFSIVKNRVLRTKMPGKSYVLQSELGTKMVAGDSEIANEILMDEDVIFTSNFNGSNLDGGYITGKGGYKPFQVFVPSYISVDSENGPVSIDLREKDSGGDYKYLKVNQEGRLIIDPKKVDRSVLQLIGMRIPNTGHNTMAAVEVAGFLPAKFGDVIIGQQEMMTKFGHDHDLDKFYTYHRNFKLDESGKLRALDVPTRYEGTKLAQNQVINTFWDILSSPNKNIQKSVSAPMDFGEFKLDPESDSSDEAFASGGWAPLIQSLQGSREFVNPSSHLYQTGRMTKASSGKAAVGSAANAFTFHSTAQLLESPLKILSPITFGNQTADSFGSIKTLKGDRFTTDVLSAFLQASVDNENEQILEKVNINEATLPVATSLFTLGFEEDVATTFLSNPTIITLSEKIRNSSGVTSLNTEVGDSVYISALVEAGMDPADAKDVLKNKKIESNPSADKMLAWIKDPSLMSQKDKVNMILTFKELSQVGSDVQTISKIGNRDSGNSISGIASYLHQEQILDNWGSRLRGKRNGLVNPMGYFYDPDGNPSSVNGISHMYSELGASEFLDELYPGYVQVIQDVQLAHGEGVKSININSESDIQTLGREVVSFLGSKASLYASDSTMELERKRLMSDSPGDPSLARVIYQIQETGQLGQNAFFSKLIPKIGLPGTESLVEFNAAQKEDVDDDITHLGFASLISRSPRVLKDANGDPIIWNGKQLTTRTLGQELVLYHSLTGNKISPRSFGKYIPVGYLKTIGFGKIESMADRINTSLFAKQFLQNNPRMIPLKIRNAQFESSTEKVIMNGKAVYLQAEAIYDENGAEISDIAFDQNVDNGMALVDGLIYHKTPAGWEYLPSLEDSFRSTYDQDTAILEPLSRHVAQTEFPEKVSKTVEKPRKPAMPAKVVEENSSGVLNFIALESDNANYRAVAGLLKDNVNKLNLPAIKLSDLGGATLGIYDARDNSILIDRKLFNDKTRVSDLYKVILEESLHAISLKWISKYRPMYYGRKQSQVPAAYRDYFAAVDQARSAVKSYFDSIGKDFDTIEKNVQKMISEGNPRGYTKSELIVYGMQSHEFFPRMLLEPNIQKILKNTPSESKTLFDKIIQSFIDAFNGFLTSLGIKENTVAADGIKAIMGAISYEVQGGEVAGVQGMDPNKISLNEIFETNPDSFKNFGDLFNQKAMSVMQLDGTVSSWAKKNKILGKFNSLKRLGLINTSC